MATVEKRPLTEWSAVLTSPSKKDPKWLPLVEQIKQLGKGDFLALRPDEGEELRALKVQVSKAAKAAGRLDHIEYGETSDGQELQVRLRAQPIQRKGPRKPKAPAGE